MPAVVARNMWRRLCVTGVTTIAVWLAIDPRAGGGERRVTIRGVDDDAAAACELVSLDDQQAQLRLAAGTQRTLLRRDLWFLAPVRESPAETPPPESTLPDFDGEQGERLALVLLTNGDGWWAREIAIAEERLRLRLALPRDAAADPDAAQTAHPPVASQPCDIPLEYVRGIVWASPSRPPTSRELGIGVLWRDRRLRRGVLTVQRASFPQDALLLENGDRVEGELRACDGRLCRLETAVGEVQLPLDRAAAVALATDLLLPPPLPSEWASVLLRNGSRISAQGVTGAGEELMVQATVGCPLRVPWAAVERIDFFGERVEPLSARAPQQVEFRPYLDRDGRWERDRSLTGGPLLLRGVPQGWGLGVASGHRLTWEVGDARRFVVTVGIDDAAEGGGSVEFVLRGGDQELVRSGRCTGTDPPLELGPVSLEGIGRLTLEVEYADRGDILDLADWCRPTLLK